MTSLLDALQRGVQGGLIATGIADTSTHLQAQEVAPAPQPTRVAKSSKTAAPRVVLLSETGVLVRAHDGRLPREGELDIEPDGMSIVIRTRVGPVVVAGSLRRRPAQGTMRWAVATELHALDLEILRTVAPSQVNLHVACLRMATLAQEIASLACEAAGYTWQPTGSPEADLAVALEILKTSTVTPKVH